MARGVLIAGNWKMNAAPAETRAFFAALRADLASSSVAMSLQTGKLRAALFTPAVSLTTALECANALGAPLSVGSQNTHWEKSGAFTGEISGPMLREIGIGASLVGHSERRQYFGETDETARKRAESLLAQDFSVIFCIGETRAEREAGATESVLRRQLDAGLPADWSSAGNRFVIAYEPVWAIGTGLTATPEQAEAAHAFIRAHLTAKTSAEHSDKLLLLYGGSVTPENIATLLACPNVDGGLVGGASLKPASFLKLLAAGAERVK